MGIITLNSPSPLFLIQINKFQYHPMRNSYPSQKAGCPLCFLYLFALHSVIIVCQFYLLGKFLSMHLYFSCLESVSYWIYVYRSGNWIWNECKEDNNENQPYSWCRIPEKSQELKAPFFSDLFKLWSWKQRACLKVCKRSFRSCTVKQLDVSSVVKLNQRNSKFGESGCIIGLGKVSY